MRITSSFKYKHFLILITHIENKPIYFLIDCPIKKSIQKNDSLDMLQKQNIYLLKSYPEIYSLQLIEKLMH